MSSEAMHMRRALYNSYIAAVFASSPVLFPRISNWFELRHGANYGRPPLPLGPAGPDFTLMKSFALAGH